MKLSQIKSGTNLKGTPISQKLNNVSIKENKSYNGFKTHPL